MSAQFCLGCGNALEMGTAFCSKCGKQINSVEIAGINTIHQHYNYPPRGSGAATASVVLGIFGLFGLIPLALIAIILGGVTVKNPIDRGKAIAGIIMGLIGIVIFIIIVFVVLDRMEQFMDDVRNNPYPSIVVRH